MTLANVLVVTAVAPPVRSNMMANSMPDMYCLETSKSPFGSDIHSVISSGGSEQERVYFLMLNIIQIKMKLVEFKK